MLVVLVMGVTQWFKLKKEIFPETGVDIISIQVPYPNAAPEEVATGICLPIEEAIQDVDGIKRVTSRASESVGSVNIEVENGFSLRNVMDDVKTRVDAITNLAENAEEPTIQELLLKTQVLSVAVTADTDERTLRVLAERVRDELIASDSITQVSLAGTRNYEISIEVSEQTLREYGLTFEQVANAVRASSLDLPSGSVKTSGGEILFRTAQKRYIIHHRHGTKQGSYHILQNTNTKTATNTNTTKKTNMDQSLLQLATSASAMCRTQRLNVSRLYSLVPANHL